MPTAYSPQTAEGQFLVKELYVDLMSDALNARAGKQYIKWGSGTFFTPTDVVNLRRDPLRPINEAEGSTFVQLTVPVSAALNFDLICPIRTAEGEPTRVPVIPRISFSAGGLSGFAFTMLESGEQALYGLNAG